MNILFLCVSSEVENIDVPGIYTDLMRRFRDEGHEVYIVHPRERRDKRPAGLWTEGHVHILSVKTLNVTKCGAVERGIGQLLLESQFCRALKRHFAAVRFDLVLYSTPPITLTRVIRFAKRRNPDAITYLLLKDIFPQNALDLGMLSDSGPKAFLYNYFRRKEKQLYKVSDFIGCMSPANVRYLLEHNREIDPARVEIAPNSYELSAARHPVDVAALRRKYGLPTDRPVFIYGGNMGRPQGIPFLIRCLDAVKDRVDCHFVVVGDGTDYPLLDAWVQRERPSVVSVFRRLPKADYDELTRSCDVGLIFLDYRFTIPNYPSRLLPYLMERKPILAATDPNSDIGTLAQENGYGMYCPSNSVPAFVQAVDRMLASDLRQMGEKGYRFFLEHYTAQHTYEAVMKHFKH